MAGIKIYFLAQIILQFCPTMSLFLWFPFYLLFFFGHIFLNPQFKFLKRQNLKVIWEEEQ